MTVEPKRQVAWLATSAVDLVKFVSVLLCELAYLSSMQNETLRSFGHFINSRYQLAFIRLHTTHADAKLRDLCTI